MSLIAYAMRMAKEYYDDKTYTHAARVAQYVAENNMIPDDKMDNCIALAWMHDLFEDTDFGKCEVVPYSHICNCLDTISRKEGFSYIEYIENIKRWSNSTPEAYWVKLADMKDHLAQTETLTDKLKEKYLAALPYLL